MIFLLGLFVLMAGTVHASETFTVDPGKKQAVSINLGQGDSVNGTFSIAGGSGTGVDFMVSDPSGKSLMSYNFTSGMNFSFSASTGGFYFLSFDNSFCSCAGGKNVTLSYEVNKNQSDNFSLGASSGSYPEVLALIGIAVALAAFAVAVLLKRVRINANKVVASH